jgi:hypothetical protein
MIYPRRLCAFTMSGEILARTLYNGEIAIDNYLLPLSEDDYAVSVVQLALIMFNEIRHKMTGYLKLSRDFKKHKPEYNGRDFLCGYGTGPVLESFILGKTMYLYNVKKEIAEEMLSVNEWNDWKWKEYMDVLSRPIQKKSRG